MEYSLNIVENDILKIETVRKWISGLIVLSKKLTKNLESIELYFSISTEH